MMSAYVKHLYQAFIAMMSFASTTTSHLIGLYLVPLFPAQIRVNISKEEQAELFKRADTDGSGHRR